MIDNKREHPCHNALECGDACGGARTAQFIFHCRDCCDTRRIQQNKGQEGGCRSGGQHAGQAAAGQNGEGGNNCFLCREARNQCGSGAPVAEAERREDRREERAEHSENAVRRVCRDIQARVKGLQEPDNDGCNKDNRKCTFQKIACLIPQQHADIARAGHAVIWQLHDERHRLTLEGGILEHERSQNADCHAADVQQDHRNSGIMREKCHGNDRIDRQLGRARHKRCQHDGHAAVALTRQRARRHDGGHRVAEADEHRDKGTAGQTDFAQQLVHDKRDTRHITAVFQNGEEEEQHDNGRQE